VAGGWRRLHIEKTCTLHNVLLRVITSTGVKWGVNERIILKLMSENCDGVKRPGHEAGHSPPSTSEFKHVWRCTSIPQYVFIVRYLIKTVRLGGVVHS